MNKRFARFFHQVRLHPSMWLRGLIGGLLVIAGMLGPFVPILGVWMLPLGLVLLFPNSPLYRRYINWRRIRRRLKERRNEN